MQTYIVTRETIISLFNALPIFKPGDIIEQTDLDKYRVLDKAGEEKAQIDYEILKQIPRRTLQSKEAKARAKEIGEMVKKARTARGMTLQDLADRMEATRQYIHSLEAGRKPMSLEQLHKICDILNFELRVSITRKYEK